MNATLTRSATAAPCPPFPFGATATLTDAQVQAFLNLYHPAVAQEFMRGTKCLAETSACEFPLCGLRCGIGGDYCDLAESNVGTPVHELMIGQSHWTQALFPGCGSVEVCGLAARILTEDEAQALSMTFADGLSAACAAAALGVSPRTVYTRLTSARRKLFAAFKDGELPRPEGDVADRRAFWESVMKAAPAYRRPSKAGRRRGKKTYVCDCGRHLSLLTDRTPGRYIESHLDHRRVDRSSTGSKGKSIPERILKCPCGKNHPESRWKQLMA